MNVQIKKQEFRKKKGKMVKFFKTIKISEESSPEAEIDLLKKQKCCFIVVENDVEKTFFFNGNNYVVSLKNL